MNLVSPLVSVYLYHTGNSLKYEGISVTLCIFTDVNRHKKIKNPFSGVLKIRTVYWKKIACPVDSVRLSNRPKSEIKWKILDKYLN